jgi:hypothetical protein
VYPRVRDFIGQYDKHALGAPQRPVRPARPAAPARASRKAAGKRTR